MRNSLWMAADIPGAKNIDFFTYRHFDLSFNDVGERFMRMNMQWSANTRLIMNLQQSHFITFDQRLYQKIAFHRFSFDGFYNQSFDVRVFRKNHKIFLSRLEPTI